MHSITAPRAARPSPILRVPPFRLADASDEHLLRAVRSGHDDAYGELYRRHQVAVRRYARSLVPLHEVDDLVSDAFGRMLQALRRPNGPVDHPIRYLMVTTRNRAITLRKNGRREEETRRRIDAQHDTTDDEPPEPDDLLIEAFCDLSPRRRQALWWNIVDGLSPVEIGERMDLNPAAVSALLYRAKRALRTGYARQGQASESAD